MIKQLKDFPDKVLAFACHGYVTRADYQDVLVHAVTEALKNQEKIRLYYETGSDFTGIEPGAMLEDLKVGVEHLIRWERFAIVSDIDWIKHTMQFFSFLMPGVLRVFPLSDAAKARQWITAKDGVI